MFGAIARFSEDVDMTLDWAAFESVEELIRAARNGRSQKEFADLLKASPSMMSKCERGKIGPPISTINHCMRLVHAGESEATPTAEQFAEQVRVTLADPDLGQVRSALSRLVDAFASEHAQPRATGAPLQ